MEKVIGPGGSECYRITHESGAEVTIAQQGGHLISWKNADGHERFYLSPDASFSEGDAIRGGVPVIFPQFNQYGPFSRHGFARKSQWQPDVENGSMYLEANAESLAEWPHHFTLTLQPILSETTLSISLTVHNTGSTSFNFQAALHTYFQIDNFEETNVTGLEGLTYQDEVTKQSVVAGDQPITLGTETDRAYFSGAIRPILLHDGSAEIAVESQAFQDAVIWNPGPDHGIGDLPAEDWRKFVCIESAQIDPRITLEPGHSWKGVQRLSCSWFL